MKKTLLLATVLLAAGANAQLVESGFEDWTDGAPNGWGGSRSHTTGISVEQVTENVHGGSSALRIIVPGSDHRRYTTQPVTVEAGVEYTVTFWVRGAGQIRVGLFDDRASGSGFSPYTPYTTASNTWTQVTETITAVNSTSSAEFILSCRSTTAPDHLVVDDVTITSSGGITEVSIHDIQFTTNPNGDSPYVDQVVSTSGIVTATYITFNDDNEPQYRYTYLQDGTGPWNGIVIFDYYNNNNVANIGDALTVIAEVDEFNGLTELTGIQSFTVTATGQPLPAPLVVETGDLASEALESVLVQVVNATCTEAPGGANFGKYKVNDGSGDAVVGKVIYTTTPEPTVGQVLNVTGVVSFAFGEYNLQPRFAEDVEFATAVAEVGALSTATLFPNPAADVVTVDLGAAAGQQVSYRLTDMVGRTIATGLVSDARFMLNVTGLSAGRYHLELRTEQLARTVAVQVVR